MLRGYDCLIKLLTKVKNELQLWCRLMYQCINRNIKILFLTDSLLNLCHHFQSVWNISEASHTIPFPSLGIEIVAHRGVHTVCTHTQQQQQTGGTTLPFFPSHFYCYFLPTILHQGFYQAQVSCERQGECRENNYPLPQPAGLFINTQLWFHCNLLYPSHSRAENSASARSPRTM